ncbi:hypothetical protein ACJX0J_020672, partial [Zea mays]
MFGGLVGAFYYQFPIFSSFFFTGWVYWQNPSFICLTHLLGQGSTKFFLTLLHIISTNFTNPSPKQNWFDQFWMNNTQVMLFLRLLKSTLCSGPWRNLPCHSYVLEGLVICCITTFIICSIALKRGLLGFIWLAFGSSSLEPFAPTKPHVIIGHKC